MTYQKVIGKEKSLVPQIIIKIIKSVLLDSQRGFAKSIVLTDQQRQRRKTNEFMNKCQWNQMQNDDTPWKVVIFKSHKTHVRYVKMVYN